VGHGLNIEIETKVRVDSLEPVEERLTALGAESLGEVAQVDTYFDDAEKKLLASDRGLRIRCETAGDI